MLNGARMRRIQKELVMLKANENKPASESNLEYELEYDDSNLNSVVLKIKPENFKKYENSPIYRQLTSCGIPHIAIELRYGEQFPFEPPFFRVISPVFVEGAGLVHKGALCHEILSTGRWVATTNMVPLVELLLGAMIDHNASIDTSKRGSCYDLESAKSSFEHLMNCHTEWKRPKNPPF